jgi:hypothetical protein
VRATFTAHGDRLPGHLPSFPSADICCIHSIPIRQGRTLRHLARCGPSPCTRLSRVPTTMATLTLFRRVRGFLRLFPTPYFRSRYPHLKSLPCSHCWTQTRSRRWRLSTQPIPHIAAPEWVQGKTGLPVPSFGRLNWDKPLRRVERFIGALHTTRCPVRQSLETGARFPVG